MHRCRDWQGDEWCIAKSVLQMQSTEMENQILAILKYVTCLSYSDLFHSRCVCIVTHKSKYAEPHAAFFAQVFKL